MSIVLVPDSANQSSPLHILRLSRHEVTRVRAASIVSILSESRLVALRAVLDRWPSNKACLLPCLLPTCSRPSVLIQHLPHDPATIATMTARHAIPLPLDAAELTQQLKNITPPPGYGEDASESDALNWLRDENVPICDQKECIPYWRASGMESYCAQKASWQAFQRERADRTSPLQSERDLRAKQRGMRAARRAHALTHVPIRLEHRSNQDSMQTTWVEYQDYLIAKDGQRHEGNSFGKGENLVLERERIRKQIQHKCFLKHVLPWTETIGSRTNRRSGRTRNRPIKHGQPRGKIRYM
jgi:hypothetical protein